MGFKVANIWSLPGEDYNEEKLAPYNVSLVRGLWMTEDEILANTYDADAIIGCVSVQPFTLRLLEKLKNCRIIAGVGIGYDTTDVEAATRLGVAVTNVPDYCLDEVSGLALTFMLSLGHKIRTIDLAVRKKHVLFTVDRQALADTAYPIFRMRDQTLGIIGLGKVGTTLALKVRGLGMKVIAHDPYVLGPVMESRGVVPVDFDTLLAESDFISLHTPLNAETRGLMTYDCYRKMKKTCYFINTSRGGCVDQPGLIRALQEGLIAGAGIDVTIDEPISEENPLLGMPNVILTGHSAWYSVTAQKGSCEAGHSGDPGPER